MIILFLDQQNNMVKNMTHGLAEKLHERELADSLLNKKSK